MFDGVHEAELLSWLLGTWRDDGPAVCVVEGFSGIGKTSAAYKALKAWEGPSALVSATEDADLESLLFTIAAKLETSGYTAVADHTEGDFRLGVLELLQNDSLIVIDDFDALLSRESSLPPRDVRNFVAEASRLVGNGRLLIITGQSFADGDWLENCAIKTMAPPGRGNAERILAGLLDDRGLLDTVPAEKFGDIVDWLGRNIRAMRAFVACLRDDPLEELIDIGAEAWDLRDRAATPQMIAGLERIFLDKTIDRLDPPALLVLEFLSVYRSTFTVDVIRSSAPPGVRPETARESLTARFLLGRHGNRNYYLNPVARQLALSRIGKDPQRRQRAHNYAADYYAKRVRPTNERAAVRAGADFLEARYHLVLAGRESEFQDLAGDYRRLLLRNYRNVVEIPENPEARAQLLATLIVALSDVDAGYPRLRTLLAELLAARGRSGDDRLAYRHVTIATREARDRGAWLLRVRLAARLDSPNAMAAAARQALDLLAPAVAADVVVTVAEELAVRSESRVALEALNDGLKALPVEHRQRLYSAAAYLLARQNRHAEAIDLLLDGYQESGPGVQYSWRLFEQALFIAFERRDRVSVSRIKQLMIEQGKDEHQPALCDILDYELSGRYEAAAELAEHHQAYFPAAAQGAFCWLVAGEPGKASDLLDKARFQPNKANWWLRGVIAACNGGDELYREAMSRACGHPLGEEEKTATDLWLRIWEQMPTWIGIFPAFYFPRLPGPLTALPEDLAIPADGVSATVRFPEHDFTLWHLTLRKNLPADAPGGDEEKRPVMTGDTYNFHFKENSGDLAVGRKASISKVLPPGASTEDLAASLRALGVKLREDESPPAAAEAAAAIDEAVSATEGHDERRLIAALRKAGTWALDRATDIATEIAAAAITRAMRLSP